MYPQISDTVTVLSHLTLPPATPSVVSSSDSTLYIVYTSTDAGDSFKGAWEKVPSKKHDYML